MSFPLAIAFNGNLPTDADAVIVITGNVEDLGQAELNDIVAPALAIDARIKQKASLLFAENLPGKRLIVAPTGPLTRDYDDVRRIFEAAKSAINEAKAAGVTQPILQLASIANDARYTQALEVAFLGMCQALWQPLEAREYYGEGIEPIKQVFLAGASEQQV